VGRLRLTVAKLVYSAITSLDGYVADEDGRFDWAAPSARTRLELVDERCFGNGVVHLHYRTKT
jgi:hypothetical protein